MDALNNLREVILEKEFVLPMLKDFQDNCLKK